MKIIECPRDAMQGFTTFIPTAMKVKYINTLLQVGFDTIDFGSFVSPKAIPQMRDTAEVLEQLDLASGNSKLLAIIANVRGAEQACSFAEIDYLGFPLSVSETFQQRNTNKSIQEALQEVESIQNLCIKHKKTLVVYISMGFGNPYGDIYNAEEVEIFVEKLQKLQIKIISLSDTIGVALPTTIQTLFQNLIPKFPLIEFGAHFHSNPATTEEKLLVAYQAGCKRFDGALKGFGGCPMAKDELVGNIATEKMLDFFEKQGIHLNLNKNKLIEALHLTDQVFNVYQ